MTRMQMGCAVAAASLAAGAAGCAIGLLFAPASGAEIRRRLQWRARDEWKGVSRACQRAVDDVTERAASAVRGKTTEWRQAFENAVACGEAKA